MADIQLDTQGKPANPAANSGIMYVDSTNKEFVNLDDAGNAKVVRPLTNANTADVTANAADTYLTGSSISIPPALLRVGAQFQWRFVMTKTAAGVATPIVVVRFGTAGTVADAARVTYTFLAQTAATDTGCIDLDVVVRVAGASGVLQSGVTFHKTHATAGAADLLGFAVQAPPQIQQVVSAAFDMTVAASIIGVSVNPGALGVWTFQLVRVVGFNL